MTGDVQDFVWRMRSILPRGWFSETAPVVDALLSTFATAWHWIFGLVGTVSALSRIKTSFGPFLDMISVDFFGNTLVRRAGEDDQSYTARICLEMLRSRATRSALDTALWQLTGRHPIVVEPARPMDTGGYSVGGVGYGQAGAWGSLLLPHSCFVTAFRAHGEGIAYLAGYSSGGVLAYANLSMVPSVVTDEQIFASAVAVLPLGCVAWMRIEH